MESRDLPFSVIAALSISIAFATVGCAPRETELVRVVQPSELGDSWVGRTEEALVAVWGEPSVMKPDGKGGRVLSYTRARVEEKRTEMRSPPSIEPGSKQTSTETVATFWIDASGQVERARMSPKLADTEFLRPPSRESTSP